MLPSLPHRYQVPPPIVKQPLTIPKDTYDQLQPNFYAVANAIREHLRDLEQQFANLQYGHTQYANAYKETMANQSAMSNEIAKLRYALGEAEQKATTGNPSDSQSQVLSEELEWHRRRLREAESLLTSLGYERRDKGWIHRRGSRRAAKTVIPE